MVKCWNCGTKMTPSKDDVGHPYELCPECGASYYDLPYPHAQDITPQRDYFLSPKGAKVIKSSSPSRIAQRRAAKARGDTKDETTPKATTGHVQKGS